MTDGGGEGGGGPPPAAGAGAARAAGGGSPAGVGVGVEELRLVRADPAPWGFRLMGGRDYSHPLTVTRVSARSLFQNAFRNDFLDILEHFSKRPTLSEILFRPWNVVLVDPESRTMCTARGS